MLKQSFETNMREASAVYDKDPKKQLVKEKARAAKLLKGKILKKITDTEKKESSLNLKTARVFTLIGEKTN